MKQSVSRVLSTLLVLCMALALLPGTALALHGESDIVYPVTGGSIYFDPATGTVTDCDESVRAAIIPAEIGGVPVTSIGEWAFFSCSNMTSVTIPDSVTSIGADAFHWCRSLTDVTIPASVTSIGVDAFYACKNLVSARLPDGIATIGAFAFALCSSLVDIRIPDSVTMIGEGAFASCSSLVDIRIPDSVTTIGEGAFANCSSLVDIRIPDSVTTIGEGAFANCSSLTGIMTIPDRVTSIGEGAFSRCSGLTDIKIASGNHAYIAVDGVLFNADQTLLYTCLAKKCEQTYVIPTSVTTIGDGAFSGCQNLTDVTIPDSVTSIRESAFFGCSGLRSVRIPDGITVIEYSVFSNCTGLTSVIIPDSVTAVEDNAFSDCSSLTDVYYAGSESQWEEIPIRRQPKGPDGNAALRRATIHYNSTGPVSVVEVSVTVGGKAVMWTDAAPFIDENDRTMVPLRAVADAMGLTVDWDAAAREAVFTDGSKTIYFPIGSTTARTSEGGTVMMDTAAVIKNDRSYAPIRYLAEYFGHEVGWDAATRTVIIK